MIQFNLLPDVKLQYLKALKTKRLVMGISALLSIAALVLLVILILTVDVFQKKNMSDLTRDIKTNASQLQQTPDLNKILTVQNQLKALPSLHDQKAVASRLFGYLKEVTPSSTSITDLSVDYSLHTFSIQGKASSLDIVNTYADTLKFTTYTTDASTTQNKAFSNVVLASFSTTSAGTTYTITLNYDPAIFDSAHNVTLTVPKIISTRSAVDQPTDLFQSNSGGQ